MKKLILLLLNVGCKEQDRKVIAVTDPLIDILAEKEEQQEKIIQEYLHYCALKHPLYSQERQKCLDAGLEKDPDIAYLWQQKAMPLFKQGKYEAGMEFIDKAVEINPELWRPYRAFIKCIFAKTYYEAINDFENLLENMVTDM